MSTNWFDYQDKKTAPKPSYQRPMPVQHRAPPAPEPKSEGITVEETDASDSMITRIIGKIRGA